MLATAVVAVAGGRRTSAPVGSGAGAHEVAASATAPATIAPKRFTETSLTPTRHTEVVESWIPTALEVAMVVATGGMLVAAVRRLRRGEVRVYRCCVCERPTSRGYPCCRHCGATQPDAL